MNDCPPKLKLALDNLIESLPQNLRACPAQSPVDLKTLLQGHHMAPRGTQARPKPKVEPQSHSPPHPCIAAIALAHTIQQAPSGDPLVGPPDIKPEDSLLGQDGVRRTLPLAAASLPQKEQVEGSGLKTVERDLRSAEFLWPHQIPVRPDPGETLPESVVPMHRLLDVVPLLV